MAGRRVAAEDEDVLRRTLILFLAALVAAGPATAGTIVVELHFAPGKLTFRSAPAIAEPGAAVRVPLTVADGRGNGKGWTVKVRPTGLRVVSVTATCAAGSTCTLPRAAARPSVAVVLRAAKGTGMGIVNLVVTLQSTARTPVAFDVT
jgi:hypothetical protein